MQNIELMKFDPKSIEQRRVDPNKGPATIVIIGSRGTGKSYLIQDLMYFLRRIPAGMIFTGSQSSAEDFEKFFPKSFIFDEVDLERIGKVVANQKKLRKQKTEGDYSSLLLFDDCGYDKSVTRQKIIKEIFCNGRHYKLLLLMTVQYCKDIPPDLRSNADYVFIMREPSIERRRVLWKEFASVVPTFNMFNDAMNVCTDDRGVLVIDKTATSNKVEDSVFWYRAKTTPKTYKVGSKSLWKFHEDNYKSEDEDEPVNTGIVDSSKTVNIKKIKSKKKKPKLKSTIPPVT
jgi:hypothetical protein